MTTGSSGQSFGRLRLDLGGRRHRHSGRLQHSHADRYGRGSTKGRRESINTEHRERERNRRERERQRERRECVREMEGEGILITL